MAQQMASIAVPVSLLLPTHLQFGMLELAGHWCSTKQAVVLFASESFLLLHLKCLIVSNWRTTGLLVDVSLPPATGYLTLMRPVAMVAIHREGIGLWVPLAMRVCT
eukprot:5945504-Ditylum_brightwellii.AAC.1